MAIIIAEVSEGFLKALITIAKEEDISLEDDFMVDDYASGNIDDAYNLWLKVAEIQMAQYVLAQLGQEY